MNDKIYKKIESYNTIVIARHIGADPDALASQLGLRESIKLTFPTKKVYAVGAISARFKYFPKLDKQEEFKDALLIVVDTPDKKRVDINSLDNFKYKIKIDHHPFVEEFCNIEHIVDTSSSASELILELINETPLKINKKIARILFMGIASDTERFLFNTSPELLIKVANIIKTYDLDIEKLYNNVFKRPISEVRLQGYIAQNMLVTENGLAYIFISDDVMKSFSVDAGSAGNLINNFSNIENILVRVFFSEDVKNKLIKINIRSSGPVINGIAEKYNGGGHKFASGIRLTDPTNLKKVLADLDEACALYKEEERLRNEDK